MSFRYSGVDRLLLTPRRGAGVCPRCLNLTDALGLCRACRANEHHLAAIVPISYSVGGEWLHRLVASYKRAADPSVPDALAELAQILDSFLRWHECCVAGAAKVNGFGLVTTVPSGDRVRDLHHPLRRIVGELVPTTRSRYERLLVVSGAPVVPRLFDPTRYWPTRKLGGEAVLLVDDMWTSGASAESAAAALLSAGAGVVAVVVVARHLNRGWHENNARLRLLARDGFDPRRCVACSSQGASTTRPAVALGATAGRPTGGASSFRP